MAEPATAYAQEGAWPATARLQVRDPGRPYLGHSNGHAVGTALTAPNDSLNTFSGQTTDGMPAPRPQLPKLEPLTFQRLEQRDGVVLHVNETEGVFRARLVDPLGEEPDQEVEIDLQQVSLTDLALVAPGALFFWAIGYVTRRTGRRNLVLALDFRRLPRLRRDVEERAERAGERCVEDMNWG